MRTHFANSRLLLLAPVSQALYEGAVLSRVEMAGLRELAGAHVQPRIRPEVEHSVKMELHWPCLSAAHFVHGDVEWKVLPEPGSLDLDQSRAPIRIERLDIVSGAGASGLGSPFDSLREITASAVVRPLALELENELLPASSDVTVCSVLRDEVESTEAGRRRPHRLPNPHRFWGRLDHAIHLQSLSAGRTCWIEHGSRDQRLEEVAMDVEVLQHRLLEKRLEVEAGLVAVDVRI
jgi:hypothetical protein